MHCSSCCRCRDIVRRLKKVENLLQHAPGRSGKGVQPADDGEHTPDAVLGDGRTIWHEQPGAQRVCSALVGLHKALNCRISAACLEAGQVHGHSQANTGVLP